MAKVNTFLHSFNVGRWDKKHLVRVDLERNRLAAETQQNIIPLATGPGLTRPGLRYINSTLSNAECRPKEFVFGAADAALLEFTDLYMRVSVADDLITRPSVSATVQSGDFSASTGWTLTATDGATCTVSGGQLLLLASAKGSSASATQTFVVSNNLVVHALRIVVSRGPVTFRLGSTSGGDDYIGETTLRTGTHSLAFLPSAGNCYIEFKSDQNVYRIVDSCQIEAAGVMVLPTPWPTADLWKIRFAQSADVIFCACDGYQQRRIERRAELSWSVVLYTADDGPFTIGRTRDVKLAPSATSGNATLTASADLFLPTHVGALFSLFQEGFNRTMPLAGAGQFTDPFKVTGVYDGSAPATSKYNDRNWNWTVAGTWVGTVTVMRTFDDKAFGYKDFVLAYPGTTTPSTVVNVGPLTNMDADQNAIIWYKIGFKESNYTSGVANVSIDYDGGGGTGVCRVTAYTSPTSVEVEILSPFYSLAYTDSWREGEWSDASGWPSSVALSDGRLWWSGNDRFWGSVSDGFESFDDETEGDSAPISRSIATGGINKTQWLLPLARMNIGTEGSITIAKSSSLDEPITPTNLSLKDAASIGAAPIDAIKVDNRGIYVDRAGRALYEISFDGSSQDYIATQISKLATDMFADGIKTIAVQRTPDTRIWVVMTDGSCVCMVYEPTEDVVAFVTVVTDGLFEGVAVLPAVDQDRVYFSIKRTINGATVRYIEKMAADEGVAPTTRCYVMDAYTTGSGAAITSGTYPQLAGRTDLVVWADGAPLAGSFTANSAGVVQFGQAISSYVIGIPYNCRYKSARLAYGAQMGTAMLQKKKVNQLGLIMTDFVRAGIRYGAEFDNAARPLDPLPTNKDGITAPAIVLSDVAEEEPFVFAGQWDTDSRVCLEWTTPTTATLLGLVLQVESQG